MMNIDPPDEDLIWGDSTLKFLYTNGHPAGSSFEICLKLFIMHYHAVEYNIYTCRYRT